MLPPLRPQHGLCRTVDQKDLVIHPRRDDLADARDRNSIDGFREFRRDDDQFILFAAVQSLRFRCVRRAWDFVLIDSGRDPRLFSEMQEVGRKTVADVDHGMRSVQKSCAYGMAGLWIKM